MKTIILAGGSGTRLWPLSREYFPKQFLKLSQLNGNSLFQLTFLIAIKVSNLEDVIIVTNEKYKFLVMGEIEELGFEFNEENILIEPYGRNTLPAIAFGLKDMVSSENVLILPSDHLIKNPEELINSLEKANELAKTRLVTFGINPLNPNTGYGYIEVDGYDVKKFVEKPSKELAENYILKGYLWNSGIFFFNKGVFDSELKKYSKEIYNYFNSNNFNINNYENLENISVDFGLLEKSSNIASIKLNLKWSDLGSFSSIYDSFEKDLDDNLSGENCLFFNSRWNLVQSSEKKLVVLSNINNLVIIDTDDALLIAQKNDSQAIKNIVAKLNSNSDSRVNFHTTVYRPWGSYTILEEGNGYQVKRLTVNPGKILSLQKHFHRSEHWTVIKGEATVINGETEFILKKNESTYIPKESKHRLENKSDEILELIETQSGDYLGEDDIIRFEDKYGRK